MICSLLNHNLKPLKKTGKKEKTENKEIKKKEKKKKGERKEVASVSISSTPKQLIL